MDKINIIGVYDDPDQFTNGVRKIREGGFKVKNAFSPFPVHAIWDEMKMNTLLPLGTFIFSALGTIGTFAFLYWTSVVNYPLKFGGKPLASLSFIIIMFVSTILIGVTMTLIMFFIRQKIGPGKKSVMIDPRTVDDKFIIVIEKDPTFTEAEVLRINNLLKESGATEITEKPEPSNFREERDE
jgi:hypothetical protein